jgi:hypothetical protein
LQPAVWNRRSARAVASADMDFGIACMVDDLRARIGGCAAALESHRDDVHLTVENDQLKRKLGDQQAPVVRLHPAPE